MQRSRREADHMESRFASLYHQVQMLQTTILQSQLHQQSLHYHSGFAWPEHFDIRSVQCGSEDYENLPQGRRNRKGLKERLRQKRNAPTTSSVPTSKSDVSNSDDHKVWHSSEDSEHNDHSSETTLEDMLASTQEELKASRLCQKELQQVVEDLRVRETELDSYLQEEKGRADQGAVQSATLSHALEVAEDQSAMLSQRVLQLEAVLEKYNEEASQNQQQWMSEIEHNQQHISELAADLASQTARSQAAEEKVCEFDSIQRQRTLEYEGKLHSVESEKWETYSNYVQAEARAQRAEQKVHELEDLLGNERSCRADLELKLRTAEIENGAQTVRALELEKKVKDMECRISELTAKLRSAEIESGTQTARALKTSQRVDELQRCLSEAEKKLFAAEIESGKQTARAMKFRQKVEDYEIWCYGSVQQEA